MQVMPIAQPNSLRIVLITHSFSATYNHASSPPRRRDVHVYIVLIYQKNRLFQIKIKQKNPLKRAGKTKVLMNKPWNTNVAERLWYSTLAELSNPLYKYTKTDQHIKTMKNKFGFLVKNDILRQCITEGSPVYQVVFRKVLDWVHQ